MIVKLSFIVFVVLGVLKFSGAVAISYWLLFSPLLLVMAVPLVALFFIIVVSFIIALGKHIRIK